MVAIEGKNGNSMIAMYMEMRILSFGVDCYLSVISLKPSFEMYLWLLHASIYATTIKL